MTRRPSAIASLDIEQEGQAQQDGLAERLARQRRQKNFPSTSGPRRAEGESTESPLPVSGRDRNSWRRGKSLIQVAIPDDAHIELGIIAKRRRTTLSQIVKSALNEWLSIHGHDLQIPD